MRLLTLLTLLLIPSAAWAQEAGITFRSPLDCTFGANCWVMNYVDHTPEGDEKAVDAACAARTYDGHKGTDFAIPDEAAMIKGVDVLAAANGKISRVRNAEEDRLPTAEQLAKTKADKKECGNAVLIDHGKGWQTMYCHLKKNSITVKIGDTVKQGDKIASVGLSGYTQFPHLHFGVIKDGKVMDPFSGTDASQDCSKQEKTLWDANAKIHYEDLAIFASDFSDKVPDLEKLDKNLMHLKMLSAKEAPALLFYTLLGGVQQGDIISLYITAPDGSVFAERTQMQEKTRARQLLFVGRRTDEIQLQSGDYKGKLIVKRKDETWQKETILTVKP